MAVKNYKSSMFAEKNANSKMSTITITTKTQIGTK